MKKFLACHRKTTVSQVGAEWGAAANGAYIGGCPVDLIEILEAMTSRPVFVNAPPVYPDGFAEPARPAASKFPGNGPRQERL